MKLSATSSSLAALATMGSLIVPGAAAAADPVEYYTEISFKSENEIVDTPKSLAILEETIIRAADASHDSDVWQLVSDVIVSSSHSPVDGNGRKLRPYLQYNQVSSYDNTYESQSTNTCGSCRRRLGEGILSMVQDDAAAHANWEATLCELLNESEGFTTGVSDCVISFVDPPASDVAKEKVKYLTDITFKTTAQVYDSAALLKAIETALLKAADATHDPDTWFLDNTEIISFSHSSADDDTANEGERKLRPYLQYNQVSTYDNTYESQSTNTCGSCRRRRLEQGGGVVVVKDDGESHANWEATLCKLLGEIDGLEGVTDCAIEFVVEE